MTKSEENLQTAFAGESQANRKYTAFAKAAEKDGFPQVARLFRAAAAAEAVHAMKHLKKMGGVKSTAENLQAAIDGEHHEFTEMYPEFLRVAKEEGHKGAIRTFHFANAVEKVHHELYVAALESVKAGKDLEETPVHVCRECGYTVRGEVPDRCPVCGVPPGKFSKID
ncbi:MAG: rubrerythrin family protein [Promethearchaeota archaeon]